MEILDYFDSFYKIGKEAKQELKNIIIEKQYGKNAIVQDIGNTCRTLYFVKEGGARIFYYNKGNDITEHFAFKNEIIVRAESLFTGQTTTKGIETIEKTIMFTIDANALFRLYDDYHNIERLFRLIFENEFVNAIRRIESFQLKTATERYIELLNFTDWVQKIPLKHIASYLGITQVSLSRIRASLT
ncbi:MULTISPECIES: Crp/Fnr family transcriptional regulator [Flavobacteriaceae]|jgi:CRP-like cAMP-binding protein|uniref:CRP-like cAMP-binding protein n=1 Tax=Marinirhabdus gelatinilytica TaxID=1703343 RepID=A0A370QKT7_9FLAO|nr:MULTISPECIES: Crp/Fnr family transcriptional regulator [Flavobacteriaceae]RDK88949.1 CRP-like cAMP-binding protein [Marinirhabdus gelatinilytica]|tara:strand:+ start:313 stop:873 length:561 start_codon:yes stop_codon:yes gene_type:complete